MARYGGVEGSYGGYGSLLGTVNLTGGSITGVDPLGDEGTFTPGIAFGGGVVGITYTTQSAAYVKQGGWVWFSGRVTLSAKGSSTGSATLTGLPFTVRNNADSNSIISIQIRNTTYTGQAMGLTNLNATTIALQQVVEAGTASNLADTNFTNTSDIFFSGFYQVA
jgi:hypothetical protein